MTFEYIPTTQDYIFLGVLGFKIPVRNKISTDYWYVRFKVKKHTPDGILFDLICDESGHQYKHLVARYYSSTNTIRLLLHDVNETLIASSNTIINVEEDMWIYYFNNKIYLYEPENDTSTILNKDVLKYEFFPDHVFIPRTIVTGYDLLQYMGLYPGFNQIELDMLLGLRLSIEYADEYVPPVFDTPPIIVTKSLPVGIIGKAYSATLLAIATYYPLIWYIDKLPQGLTLDINSGIISGTPTTQESFTVGVTVTDQKGSSASVIYTFTIREAPFIITETLPLGIINEPYMITLSGDGGTIPYTWSANNLPTGLVLNETTGELSGIPTSVDTRNVTIYIQDDNTLINSKFYTLKIVNKPKIAEVVLDPLIFSQEFNLTLSLLPNTGTNPYTWEVTNLPTGLTFNPSTLVISGIVTGLGSYIVKIHVKDIYELTDTIYVEMNIGFPDVPILEINKIDNLRVFLNQPIENIVLQATGGIPPYTWKVTNLPTGLTFNPSTLTISGTPTVSDTRTVIIEVIDTVTNAFLSFDIAVVSNIKIADVIIPDGYVDKGTCFTYSEFGCNGIDSFQYPYTWEVNLNDIAAADITTYFAQNGINNINQNPLLVILYPNKSGLYTFFVKVIDRLNTSDQKSIPYTIYERPQIDVNNTIIPSDCTKGFEYNGKLQGIYGKTPYTYTLSSTSMPLPNGLSINNSTGTITGIPIIGGTYYLDFVIIDANNVMSETYPVILSIQENSFAIMTTSFPLGVVGVPYTISLEAINGTTPYTWYVISNTNPDTYYSNQINSNLDNIVGSDSISLPNGLVLHKSLGIINGTPTVDANNQSIRILCLDNKLSTNNSSLHNPRAVSRSFTLNIIYPISLIINKLVDIFVGTSFTVNDDANNFSVTGGKEPYTWNVTGLPTGLSLGYESDDSSRTNVYFIGTCTVTGTFNIILKVTDSLGNTNNISISLSVFPVMSITTSSLPDGYVNEIYNQTLIVINGTPPYWWTITNLPNGLDYDPDTGIISGIPTIKGEYTISITVTDTNGYQASKALTFNVHLTPVEIDISGFTEIDTTPVSYFLNDLYVDDPIYTKNLTATGGKPPYRWYYSENIPGATISYITGQISIDPQLKDGDEFSQTNSKFLYTFSITVNDTYSPAQTDTKDFTFRLLPKRLNIITDAHIETYKLHSTDIHRFTTIEAEGGIAPYTWDYTNKPNWMNIILTPNLTIFLQWLPHTQSDIGTHSFTLKIIDDCLPPHETEKTFTITVLPADLKITYIGLPFLVVNQAFSETITGTGGIPPYTWSATGLPSGLSINSSTGVISGTPTTVDAYYVTLTLADTQTNNSVSIDVLFHVNSDLEITTTALPTGKQRTNYSYTLSASGGTSPYTWSVDKLPNGLHLNPFTGEILGIPSQGYPDFHDWVTVTLKDNINSERTKKFYLQIYYHELYITSAIMPNGYVGVSYSYTLSAIGGTTLYTWYATDLPSGLSINSSTGVISGTPTVSGNYFVTIIVRDTQDSTDSIERNIDIYTKPSITTLSLPNTEVIRTSQTDIVGIPYSTTMSGTGGTTPYTWYATGLPSGLSINSSTGVISGTPIYSSSTLFTVTITLKDANNYSVDKVFNIVGTYTASDPNECPAHNICMGY
jgi:hypothetical protein